MLIHPDSVGLAWIPLNLLPFCKYFELIGTYEMHTIYMH
jgi:hypothetical protein